MFDHMPLPQSISDKLWTFLFFIIVLVCGFGVMFFAGAYLTPELVGPPIDGERHGAAAVVEFILLFGGLFAGFLVGMRLTAFVSRRFVDTATQDR
jgi:hypothetical protein